MLRKTSILVLILLSPICFITNLQANKVDDRCNYRLKEPVTEVAPFLSRTEAEKNSVQFWSQLNFECKNLSNLNLSNRYDDLKYSRFNTSTVWPANNKLPKKFRSKKIMDVGENPGLGLRKLHSQGINGKDVSIAIIDQTLLLSHVEYKDTVVSYESIDKSASFPQMHGSAVSSLAVGKTVGVAPMAKLYYFADNSSGADNITEAINRVIVINKKLPLTRKIRAISISLGLNSIKNNKKVLDAVSSAEKDGIFVIYVEMNGLKLGGIGRKDLYSDPDNIKSYRCCSMYPEESMCLRDDILVPIDNRTFAGYQGDKTYTYGAVGGISWAEPYMAGIYALAAQVKPRITKDEFVSAVKKTATNVDGLGKVINPTGLIDELKK